MTRTLANEENLKASFEKYLSTLERTVQRRQLWTSETKNKIIETLTTIQNAFKMGWHVQRIEQAANYQTINICIAPHNSGIVETIVDYEKNRTTKKSYTKHGGYLAYCQSYNGKVNVIIGFPYIDEWVSQMDAKIIATVEPSDISEDMITTHVVKFLQTMEEWEGKDRETIGFK